MTVINREKGFQGRGEDLHLCGRGEWISPGWRLQSCVPLLYHFPALFFRASETVRIIKVS